MARPGAETRLSIALPPWLAERLETEVEKGRYPSVEEAVLAGARLLVGLGPRARQLLDEGEGADGLVRRESRRDHGDWR